MNGHALAAIGATIAAVLLLTTGLAAAVFSSSGGVALAACPATTVTAAERSLTSTSPTSPTTSGDGQCVASCPSSSASGSQPATPAADCLNGQAVLQRAATWLTAWPDGGPVPYASSADPATWFDGYRRDCSGYASMALGLPGPGENGRGLAARSTPIPRTMLRAGDLLINPSPGAAGHVVIFDRWVDATRTSYLGYEESGDGGTHHRVIPYPYFGNYPMSAYRELF